MKELTSARDAAREVIALTNEREQAQSALERLEREWQQLLTECEKL